MLRTSRIWLRPVVNVSDCIFWKVYIFFYSPNHWHVERKSSDWVTGFWASLVGLRTWASIPISINSFSTDKIFFKFSKSVAYWGEIWRALGRWPSLVSLWVLGRLSFVSTHPWSPCFSSISDYCSWHYWCNGMLIVGCMKNCD